MGSLPPTIGICVRGIPSFASSHQFPAVDDAARVGADGWLVVLGEAGSGKTSALARRAHGCAATEEVVWVDLSLIETPDQVDDLARVIRERRRDRILHLFCDGVDEGIHPPDNLIRRVATTLQARPAGGPGVRLTIACRKWWWTDWMTMRLEQAAGPQHSGVSVVELPAPQWSRELLGVGGPLRAESVIDVPPKQSDAAESLAVAMVLGGCRLVGNSGGPMEINATTLEVGPTRASSDLDQLVAAGVLVHDGSALRFRHWWHAEFLAAAWLARLDSGEAKRLLAPDREFPIPGCAVALPLIQVAGWLTNLSDGFRAWVTEEDPEDLLLVDRFALTDATRRALVAGILHRETRHRMGLPHLGGLRHPGLAEQIRQVVGRVGDGEGAAAKALLALHVAQENALIEVGAEVEAIIRSQREDEEAITLRVVAVQALSAIDVERLKELASALPPAPTHLRVVSEILAHLAPIGLLPATLARVVNATGLEVATHGRLEFYSYGLPEYLDRMGQDAVGAADLVCAICDAFGPAEGEAGSTSGGTDELLAALFRACWRLGDRPSVRESALNLAWSLGEGHRRQMPQIWSEGGVEQALWQPAQRRREWWDDLLARSLRVLDRSAEPDRVGGAMRAWDALPTLLGADALPALIEMLSREGDPARAVVLDVWVWSAFRLDLDEHCAAAESSLSGESTEGRRKLQGRFGRLRGGRPVWVQLRKEAMRVGPPPASVPPLDLIRRELAAERPIGERWWRVVHLLSADSTSGRLGDPWRGTIQRMNGVSGVLSEAATRRGVTQLAAQFLREVDPKTDTWWTIDEFPGLLLAGVRAAQWVVWQGAVDEVSLADWETWGPALIVTGELVGSGVVGGEVRDTITTRAPHACLRMLSRIAAFSDPARRRAEVNRAAGLAVPALDEQLVALLRRGELDDRADADLMDALVARGVRSAVQAGIERLAPASPASLERRAATCRSLLERQPDLAAEIVIGALRRDEPLFLTVLPELVSPLVATKDWMHRAAATDLEWLFLRATERAATPGEVPRRTRAPAWVSKRQMLGEGHWVFVSALRDRAHRDDLRALERLVERCATERPGLVRALEAARSEYARRAWRPASSAEIVRTLSDDGPRR